MTGRSGWPCLFPLLLAACGGTRPGGGTPADGPEAGESRTGEIATLGRRIADPPSPARTTLANGLRLVALQDAVLPLVRIELVVHAGAVFEPHGKHGLAELTAAVVRGGGTATIPKEALEVRLQELETSIEVEVEAELAVFRAWCPPARLAEALELLSHLVADPRHATETVRREIGELGRRWQARLRSDPGSVFVDRWLRSEGGSVARIDQLRELSLTDVINFHALCYRPARACAGIAGPVDPGQALRAVEKALGTWASEGPGPSPRPARPFAQSVTWLPATDHAEVAVFLPRLPPDGAHAVAHEVLLQCLMRDGLGGRISRQFAEAGLPQQAVAVARRDGSDGGAWVVRMRAPAGDAAHALQALRASVASLAAEQPRRDEVAVAVARVRARLLRASATPARQVALQARAEVLGSPPAFLPAALRRLEDLTPADLRAVLQDRRELDVAFAVKGGARPEKEAFLVQMRPEEPPPRDPTGSAPAPGAGEKARRVLALAVAALGGERSLRGLRAISWSRVTRGRDDLPIEDSTVAALPDRLRRVEKVMNTTIVTVVAGEHGASRSPRKVVTLAADECVSLTAALLRHPSLLLAHALTRDEPPTVRLLKRESIDERWLAVLELRAAGLAPVQIAVDEETGLVRRVSGSEWRPMRGPVPVEEEFEDYRPVGDLRLPHRSLLWMEGEFHSENVFRMIRPIEPPDAETFLVPEGPGR